MENNKFIDRVNKIYWKYNIGPQVIRKVHTLAVLTSITSFGKYTSKGPIGIAKALFNKEKVTLILLGGTQLKENQATTFNESKLSAYGKDNDYLKNLLNLFNTKNDRGEYIIKREYPLIISGISLGGMIAQQLINKEEIISNYKIKSILCFGSPLVLPLDRKGIRVRRFCDKKDIVPKLGEKSLKISKEDKKLIDDREKILEDGNYFTFIGAHALSYIESNCWEKYDFYGEINGGNELEILEEIKFYDAPVLLE